MRRTIFWTGQAANIIDKTTTAYGVSVGIMEANPLMRYTISAYGSVMILFWWAVASFGLYKVYEKDNDRANRVLLFLTIVYVVFAAANVSMLLYLHYGAHVL